MMLKKHENAITVVEFPGLSDQNLTKKYVEKREKYHDLFNELRQRYTSQTVVLVILFVGVMRRVPNTLDSRLQQVPGSYGSTLRQANTIQKADLMVSLRLPWTHVEIGLGER